MSIRPLERIEPCQGKEFVVECLNRIKQNCDSPHWSGDYVSRRDRIYQLADMALREITREHSDTPSKPVTCTLNGSCTTETHSMERMSILPRGHHGY
jgi:hypothetical protein